MASGARVFNGCRTLFAAAKSATPKSTATAATTTTAAKKTAVKKPTEKPAKKPKQASAEKSLKPVGILKPTPISPALGHFLGVSESARTEAVKKIWQYIKLHELQANCDHEENEENAPKNCQVLYKLQPDYAMDDFVNPTNKREIICDEKLKTIFEGRDRVGFLEIAKLLAPHFVKTT
ncbi:hypothetical protein LXL04_033656 [Taraxacum kok-saghyz]